MYKLQTFHKYKKTLLLRYIHHFKPIQLAFLTICAFQVQKHSSVILKPIYYKADTSDYDEHAGEDNRQYMADIPHFKSSV